MYSTIGIEGFVCSPSPSPSPSPSSSFISYEITGTVKERPEDFVVREILSKDDRIARINSDLSTLSSARDGMNDRLRIATMPSGPSIVLPRRSEEKPTEICNSSLPTDTISTTSLGLGYGHPASNAVTDFVPSSSTPEEIIEVYLEKVATPEYSHIALRQSLEELNDKRNSVIVWIPPPLRTTRAERKAFHRAIRIKYPFLKTESAAYHDGDGAKCTSTLQPVTSSSKNINRHKINENTEHWIRVSVEDCFDDLTEYLYAPRDDLQQLLLFRNRGFEGASPSLKPNSIIDETKNSSAVLRLRSGVTKDERRKVHHILGLKNKYFESSTSQGPRSKGSSKSLPVDKEEENKDCIIVTWKKQAIRKGARKNNKRKRHGGNEHESMNCKINGNLLCVLKKTRKEHLSAIQILVRALKCHQSDIGFAGIKDMQAITYQFITLRGMRKERVERSICNSHSGLGKHGNIELKVLSNVDYLLNTGDLEGNYFEITVRNLKRIKVQHLPANSEFVVQKTSTESFVDCDSAHIDLMVQRVKQHGFINFYGEQRVGTPGSEEEVGKRAFEIGRAMLRNEFMGAIQLLMEGKKHRESDEVRRVRTAWKDSNGDPSTTLKAFRRADIMPRERQVLRGLKRYPDNPVEAFRFLSYSMRTFYINAYQSFIFNQAASQRIKLYGERVVNGDLYFVVDGDHRDNVRLVNGQEVPPVEISQVVLPLPGYSVQYPENEIGQFYRNLLLEDNVKFERNSIADATAKGSYRKIIVHPEKFSIDISSSDSICKSMKLSFQLPKGSYATMLLRELMLTTMARKQS